MASYDVFNNNAFEMQSMTAAIQASPTVPGLLGTLGIFTPKPVRTIDVSVEKRGKTLNLIQSDERGAPVKRRTRERRNMRNFSTIRLREADKVNASEIQNVRAFGEESELQAMADEIAMRQVGLDDDLALTMENHRLGAINGLLLDADGSVITDYFSEFGIAAPVPINFNWPALTGVKTFVRENVKRPILRALGGRAAPGMQIIALCGDAFFDGLSENAEYKETFKGFADARELRNGDATFDEIYAYGVRWINYRGTDDNSTVSIPDLGCRFVVSGVRDVFQVAQSPGESMHYVNTLGLPKYSSLVVDPTGREEYVDVDVAAYNLHMCTTPEIIRVGTT